MDLSKAVFSLDNIKFGVPVGDNGCRFDEEPLEKALKQVIRDIIGDENAPMADPNDPNPDKACPVFVVATEGQDGSGPPKLFRSYGFDKDKCPIWQAGRATSAAPSYFPPTWVEVPAPGGWYIDGGLKRNNPSEVAFIEAKRHWKTAKRVMIVSVVQKTADFIENPEPPEKRTDDKRDTETVAETVEGQLEDSVQSKSTFGGIKQRFTKVASSFAGKVKAAASTLPSTSGVAQYSRIPGGIMTLKRFAKELVKLSTESEDTNRSMWERAPRDESQQFPYYRFNVPTGMDEIGLEEWKNMVKIGALTRGYLRTPVVEKEVEQCAEGLANPDSFEST